MRNLTLTPEQAAEALLLAKEGAYITTIERKLKLGARRITDALLAAHEPDASDVLREFAAEFSSSLAESELQLMRDVRAGGSDWKAKAWTLERRFPKHWAGRSEENREKDEPEAKGKAIPIERAKEIARKRAGGGT